MKKIILALGIAALLIPAMTAAQTQVTINCAANLFTQNIYNTADTQAFKDRCTAAGGVTSSGSQGTDSNGPYVVGICSNPNACQSNSSSYSPPAATQTQPAGKSQLTYIPLEPLPGGSDSTYNSLEQYLNLMFNILLSIGAMIAVITLVLGGITFMVSEVADKRAGAKRRIQAAFIGLGILLTCWLILNTINPNLTKFSLPGLDQPGGGGGGSSTAAATATTIPNQQQAQLQQQACTAGGPLCALNPAPGGGFTCSCVGV